MAAQLIENGKVNPGVLKLELFCRGIKIDESCHVEKDARKISRLRAGLGSGLEVRLDDNIHANVPVTESFVENTPFAIKRHDDATYHVYKDDKHITQVELPPAPGFYDKKTQSGKIMSRVAQMQGTYLGIYATDVCSFWTKYKGNNCKFCSTGLNLGPLEEEEKKVEDVIDTVLAARRDENISFVHFNAGYFDGEGAERLMPYAKAVIEETGLLVGVQATPAKDFKIYDEMKAMGVNHLSFCYEFHSPEAFAEICPGKEKYITQERYFDAIKYSANLFGKGFVSGEIIAGLEPIEWTHKAIDWITENKAFPTVCVFRPIPGTDYGDKPSPEPEPLKEVFAHMYEACMKHGIPVGLAPNLKISIVIQPDEGRYFLENRNKYKLTELKLAAMKVAVKTLFNQRVKKAEARRAAK
ncbi:hypothetical protein J7L05_01535 [bacterium]|nr:hypothetical protein [bacterium]